MLCLRGGRTAVLCCLLLRIGACQRLAPSLVSTAQSHAYIEGLSVQLIHTWPKTDTILLQSPYFYKSAWTHLAQNQIDYHHHAYESSMHATKSQFAILLHVPQTWQARGMLQASPSPDDSDQGSAIEDSSSDSSDSPAAPTPPAPGAGEERELPCCARKWHLSDGAKYMQVH